MTKEELLSIACQIPSDIPINDSRLEYEIMSRGVVWDEQIQLVKRIYEILEEYKEENK